MEWWNDGVVGNRECRSPATTTQNVASARLCGELVLDGLRDGIDAAENFLGGLRVSDFEAEALVQGDNELKGIDRVQTEAARAEERQLITNFTGGHL